MSLYSNNTSWGEAPGEKKNISFSTNRRAILVHCTLCLHLYLQTLFSSASQWRHFQIASRQGCIEKPCRFQCYSLCLTCTVEKVWHSWTRRSCSSRSLYKATNSEQWEEKSSCVLTEGSSPVISNICSPNRVVRSRPSLPPFLPHSTLPLHLLLCLLSKRDTAEAMRGWSDGT